MGKFFNAARAGEKASAVLKSKLYMSQCLSITNLKEDLERLPDREEIFFLDTQQAYNAFTFVAFVSEKAVIEEMYVATYSLNMRTIDALVEMHDMGLISKIHLLASDSLLKRNTRTIDYLNGLISSRPNITVQYAWVHAKVCCMKTIEGDFVVEGSGNWSENALLEQYIFLNKKEVFEARKNMILNAKIK